MTDVAGVRVGHVTLERPGWLTGTTVVVPPPGTVGGVDVRGGGPGTRETDLLDPRNLVDAVDAVVLSGGSVFGLATADGVVQGLYAAGRGWPVGGGPGGGPGGVVPIVPAAILFDLGRGGVFDHAPGAADGRAALDAAVAGPVASGSVGAGTGARAGGLRGGVGTASVVLGDGTTVGGLVVVNAVGSTVDLRTGEPYAVRHRLGEEFGDLPPADPALLARHVRALAEEQAAVRAGTATTLGVLVTDATLTKAQCAKLAGLGQDGLARAISPVHTAYDGDTVFALATGTRPPPGPVDLVVLQTAAADVLTRAVGHAVLAATSVDRTADGGLATASWRDALVGH
ncbi:MAG TPA: P1 family peptidase [Dermatophilaceae bacterium]|nr:P1 family peptidase [Dermatophilaceae bacterium]